ncbi:MAG: CRISPR-associated protein Csm3 [Symploca sp. SIO3E6]|nr:CRISPR-associated protein Csm3 [Caldora sp. SIO3E6]
MIALQDLLSNPAIETISITAVIDTALCIGAGGSSGTLADKAIVRTADQKLLIPASQLKGRLRHECEKLARGLGWPICQSPNAQTMCPQRANFPENEARDFEREEYRVPGDERYHCLICQMFGNPALPSRIIVDDLICAEDLDNVPEVLRPGVTINRRRGTAEEKKLYFLETSPANAKLRFEGQIHLQSNFPSYAKALILAGLHHINALGGSKSAGLGWLKWEFQEFSVNEEAWQALLPGGRK